MPNMLILTGRKHDTLSLGKRYLEAHRIDPRRAIKIVATRLKSAEVHPSYTFKFKSQEILFKF